MLAFEIKPFDALSSRDLYDILVLRAEVFVVEQDCAYLDPDGLDLVATHLLGREHGGVVAYARWFDEEPFLRLGRIVTSPGVRGRGFGRRLMDAALEEIGLKPVLIHGQTQLIDFYKTFGFEVEGPTFEEDGIPHARMVRPPGARLPP
jgi:ElaA protein